MKITDEMVEKAWQTLWQPAEQNATHEDVKRALSVVAPLIRSAALEEAARVADELGQRIKALLDNAVRNGNSLKSWPEEFAVAEDIGKSIRALKDKDTRTPTEGDLL